MTKSRQCHVLLWSLGEALALYQALSSFQQEVEADRLLATRLSVALRANAAQLQLRSALGWRKLFPLAHGANCWSIRVLTKSRSAISSGPTATVSRRCDNHAEIRGENYDNLRRR